MADQNEVPPQSANCDTARSYVVTPNLNASRDRCPLCGSTETECQGLVRTKLNAIYERRQCDRCGEQFFLDDDGVVL